MHLAEPLTSIYHQLPSVQVEGPSVRALALEFPRENHHRERVDHQVYASVAQLLEPASHKHLDTVWFKISPTVNGRTLIATLMEEAPSEAAMLMWEEMRLQPAELCAQCPVATTWTLIIEERTLLWPHENLSL